jgi:hypothetical protein
MFPCVPDMCNCPGLVESLVARMCGLAFKCLKAHISQYEHRQIAPKETQGHWLNQTSKCGTLFLWPSTPSGEPSTSLPIWKMEIQQYNSCWAMSMSNKVGKLSFFIKHTKSFAMASLYFFSFLHSTSAAMLLSNVNVASNFSQDVQSCCDGRA